MKAEDIAIYGGLAYLIYWLTRPAEEPVAAGPGEPEYVPVPAQPPVQQPVFTVVGQGPAAVPQQTLFEPSPVAPKPTLPPAPVWQPPVSETPAPALRPAPVWQPPVSALLPEQPVPESVFTVVGAGPAAPPLEPAPVPVAAPLAPSAPTYEVVPSASQSEATPTAESPTAVSYGLVAPESEPAVAPVPLESIYQAYAVPGGISAYGYGTGYATRY